ncbi:uncharacterized [Tachysurus ichikawai]
MKPQLRKIFRTAEERNGVVKEEARQQFFGNTKKAPSTPSNRFLNRRSYQVLKGVGHPFAWRSETLAHRESERMRGMKESRCYKFQPDVEHLLLAKVFVCGSLRTRLRCLGKPSRKQAPLRVTLCTSEKA